LIFHGHLEPLKVRREAGAGPEAFRQQPINRVKANFFLPRKPMNDAQEPFAIQPPEMELPGRDARDPFLIFADKIKGIGGA